VLENGSNIPIKDWETAKPGTNLHRIYTIASVLEVIRAALATMYRRQVNHDQDHISAKRFGPVVAEFLFRRTSCS
jgi:hypothetical protein